MRDAAASNPRAESRRDGNFVTHTTMNMVSLGDGELINPTSVCVFVVERCAALEGAIISFCMSSHPSKNFLFASKVLKKLAELLCEPTFLCKA